MSPERNEDNQMYLAVATRLAEVTGIEPDIFTPAIIAAIYNEQFIDAVVTGATPGFIRIKEDGTQDFEEAFTPTDLLLLRNALLGPFQAEQAESEDFVVAPERVLPESFTIKGLDLDNPDSEEVLAKFSGGELKAKSFTISADQIILPDDNVN